MLFSKRVLLTTREATEHRSSKQSARGADMWSYVDEVTGSELPANALQLAMKEELGFYDSMQTYAWAEDVEASQHTGKAIGARWRVMNKGDAANPDVRARLETNLT
eukprot:2009858-Amphidinium_carterae.1